MTGIFTSILNLISDLFSSVFNLVGDLVVFIFSLLMNAVFAVPAGLFGGFDTSTIANAVNGIPPQVFDLAYRLGLKEVSAMVIAAMMIKFVLQLIPFVRIGSK